MSIEDRLHMIDDIVELVIARQRGLERMAGVVTGGSDYPNILTAYNYESPGHLREALHELPGSQLEAIKNTYERGNAAVHTFFREINGSLQRMNRRFGEDLGTRAYQEAARDALGLNTNPPESIVDLGERIQRLDLDNIEARAVEVARLRVEASRISPAAEPDEPAQSGPEQGQETASPARRAAPGGAGRVAVLPGWRAVSRVRPGRSQACCWPPMRWMNRHASVSLPRWPMRA